MASTCVIRPIKWPRWKVVRKYGSTAPTFIFNCSLKIYLSFNQGIRGESEMKPKQACQGCSSEWPYTEKPLVFRGESLLSEDGLSHLESSRQPGSSHLPITVPIITELGVCNIFNRPGVAGALTYYYPPNQRKTPEKQKWSGQKIPKVKTQAKLFPRTRQSPFRARHPENKRVLVRKYWR